ncbi:MAG: D-alanine--D-alanine ligase [Desulfovibrio sp.]|jgi:D-alanine-D-alanine ligase|nr:D-alanine--D-alanine ligase [Desulfovibrio sp.]
MNILLTAGGWSSERDVSLAGAEGVRKALINLGHTVTDHDPGVSLESLAEAAAGKDFVFIMLHGSPGEDGIMQAALDRLGIPYQGSGPAGSMLALHKGFAKMLFASAGLVTAPWRLLPGRAGAELLPLPEYPLFIKADTGGSSLHMERVETPDALPAALNRLFACGGPYLAESAVDGVEITCAVLGELVNGVEVPRALPPILIKPAAGKVFDYACKYSPGGAEELCPAPIPERLTARIQEAALTAHRTLGLSGYSRADFIVPDNGASRTLPGPPACSSPTAGGQSGISLKGKAENHKACFEACPVLLEVNSLPGMTRTSLLPRAAAACGLSFDRLVERLVELGLARNRAEG